MSTRPKPFAPDDFHRAFSIAMLQWQAVEHALFQLFFLLFDAPVVTPAAAIYYSQDSFSAKLRVVDALCKVTLTKASAPAWDGLKKKLVTFSRERNALAHLSAIIDFGKDNSMEFVLAPPLYVPVELQRKRTGKFNAAKCERLANEFGSLAADVGAFATKHSRPAKLIP